MNEQLTHENIKSKRLSILKTYGENFHEKEYITNPEDCTKNLDCKIINCDIILKATNVDGIFDKDPNVYEVCKQYEQISYIDVLNKKINVMDSTSISLCMDNEIPILVFNATIHGNLKRAVMGENIGTLVK